MLDIDLIVATVQEAIKSYESVGHGTSKEVGGATVKYISRSEGVTVKLLSDVAKSLSKTAELELIDILPAALKKLGYLRITISETQTSTDTPDNFTVENEWKLQATR